MKRIIQYLAAFLLLAVAGCAAKPDPPTPPKQRLDVNWEQKTLSTVRTYISRPGRENLAKDTERFLTNPVVSVHSASQGWPDVPSVESIKRWADTPESLANLVWDECTIGTLQCGEGGGHMISVVFDTKTGQQKAVAVIPGR